MTLRKPTWYCGLAYPLSKAPLRTTSEKWENFFWGQSAGSIVLKWASFYHPKKTLYRMLGLDTSQCIDRLCQQVVIDWGKKKYVNIIHAITLAYASSLCIGVMFSMEDLLLTAEACQNLDRSHCVIQFWTVCFDRMILSVYRVFVYTKCWDSNWSWHQDQNLKQGITETLICTSSEAQTVCRQSSTWMKRPTSTSYLLATI